MSFSEPIRADLGRVLCVITGASKGFGRAVARQLSRLVQPRSALVLVARSADKLRALQAELAASEAGRAGLLVECVVADLGELEAPGSVVRACQQVFTDDMDHILLINNAGKHLLQMIDINSIRYRCIIHPLTPTPDPLTPTPDPLYPTQTLFSSNKGPTGAVFSIIFTIFVYLKTVI